MVKLKGPALSLAAHGSIADVLVFSENKGRQYAKKLTNPTNPRTGPQVGVRSMMRFLSTNFATLSASDMLTWLDLALELNASAYNAWLSYNLETWSRFLAPTKAFPAAMANDPAEINTASATALKRSIRIEIDVAEALGGWGMLLFRSTTTSFDPAIDNCIRLLLWQDGDPNPFYWTDGPLDPATYYYRVESFSFDGSRAYPYTTEFNATIS